MTEFLLSPLHRLHYGLVMIDPPWKFATYSDKGRGKSAEQHYETMSIEDILALPIKDLAHPDGMYVWLWATAPMYDQARMCFEFWEVKYVTQGVWVKMTKNGQKPTFGTGYALRNCHEPFLIGKVGKPSIHSRSIRSAILSPRREHSRKPDEAYAMADEMAGIYPKADIFSRQARPGWDAWGHETEKFTPAAEPELKPAGDQIAILPA
ncbi:MULTISPECIES: MT-A70 family methyltransferase [unclassified Bradyrhizobium]|uniref:MT-A70 family methyltransferase n=1 Tax=unclassified Bradyrhizobium TaxID=2631580 RepID=UPI0029164327|nr:MULTISPECIES: MT-A70 family methyltransferase [unclassified Bradyrhizobium]